MNRVTLIEPIGSLYNNCVGGLYFNPHFIDWWRSWGSDRQSHGQVLMWQETVYKASSSFEVPWLVTMEGFVHSTLWEQVGWGQKTNSAFTKFIPLCIRERVMPCVWLYPSLCIEYADDYSSGCVWVTWEMWAFCFLEERPQIWWLKKKNLKKGSCLHLTCWSLEKEWYSQDSLWGRAFWPRAPTKMILNQNSPDSRD